MAVNADFLNTLGVGSGLDTQSIVSAMVTAETAGKQASIDRRTEDVTADVSALAQVKSALNTLKTAFAALDDKNDFNFNSLSNGGSTAVNASLDATSAEPGSYQLKVKTLAMAEVRQSKEQTSKTADLNSGAALSFTIQVGSGTTKTVSLAAGQVSLDKAAEAINKLGIGVNAWVVQTETGKYRMLMQGPTGKDNTINISNSNYFDDGKIQNSKDAEVELNGLTVKRASNSMNDLIPGVNLELKSATNTNFNITIARDTSKAQTTITTLVDAVNAFNKIMDTVTTVKGTDGEPGALKSDSGIKEIEDKIRSIFTANSSTPGTTIKSLSEMGVSVQRDGTYKVDTTKIATALKNNYADVRKLFSADTDNQTTYGTANRGVAGDIVKQIGDYLSSYGIIKTRETTYTKTQTTLTDEQKELDTKRTAIEERYTKQFTTMNKIMDEMKNMQEYLEGQLENLPFTAKND